MAIPPGKDCWSCHWCWLGRCMHGCNYGVDISDTSNDFRDCNVYVSKEDYAKLKKPMTRDRAMELLRVLIDNLSVAERNNDVIKHLLTIGFTEDELVVDFNFCRSDVEEVSKDISKEEE